MGRKLFELEKELLNLNISYQHKLTIGRLIEFYKINKKPSITTLINDIDEIVGINGLFIGSESEVKEDDLLRKVRIENELLFEVRNKLKEFV